MAAAPDDATLEAWLARRELGEPLAWITGRTTFCGRRLHVEPGVYVPRPQTEELARRAAVMLPPAGSALDFCTGTGAVAVHLAAEVPDAFVVGVDVDPRSVECARRNGVVAVVGDLAAPLRAVPVFDVVTAVAPYVPTDAIALLPSDVQRYEPRRALDGGDDGLGLVRGVVGAAAGLLRPGGALVLELGGEQASLLAPDLGHAGFSDVFVWADEWDDPRGITARRH